jgi:phosphoglycolate phosphatase
MADTLYAFDFDGVLCDSLNVALDEYRRLSQTEFKAIPEPHSRDDLVTLFPGPLASSLRRFGLSEAECKQFFDVHSAAMRERVLEIALFPDVERLVDLLASKRSVIVTSAYSDAVKHIFMRSGITLPFADEQIMGRDLRLPKSKKIALAAERAGVAMSSTIKIGDMVSDILYARAAGSKIWGVAWGYHPPCYLSAFAPDAIIDSIDDLCVMMEESQ